ncbi:hypothetical protein [Thalassobius sp. Cn5-15]|uniref:hypothetical protein n=1 Tax=Thalassobius sp. Cn5-15 TaxID=2917763 RepID=UPI001EF23D17|nr:hypothetical protein [Thalassobius sp. Cn5-15]MCG7493362.1 hypothetical protein [Thalassobius sp. Cn5-15]
MNNKLPEDMINAFALGLRKQNAGPKEWAGIDWLPWMALRAVLETKAVKTASVWLVLVPVILTFTSEFPERYSAAPLGGQEPISFVLKIPFNWYLFYFAAVCFFIARLCYVIFCPDFIKKYSVAADATSAGITASSVRDYASGYLSAVTLKKNPLSPEGLRLNSFLSEITGSPNIVGEHWDTGNGDNLMQSAVAGVHIRDLPGTGTYLRAFKLTGNEDEDKKLLTTTLVWKFIDWLNYSKSVARALCTIFVLCGLGLLAVPFSQGFLAVFGAFMHNSS